MFLLKWYLSRVVLQSKRTNFGVTVVWRQIDDVWRHRFQDDDVTLILLECASFVGHQFEIGGWNKSMSFKKRCVGALDLNQGAGPPLGALKSSWGATDF